MSLRNAIVSLVTFVVGFSPVRAAEEIDKKPIIERWRKEIRPLKEAYANCQIAGEQWWDRDFDGDGLELHSSFKYASRARLKRLDITNAQLFARLNESWIIGRTEAYTIFRDEADKPYKLFRRAVEKDVKKYEEMRLMTPYTLLKSDRIAGGPYSIPDWGMEGPDFIAQDKVKVQSNGHSDMKHPDWRTIRGSLELEGGQTPREFSITVDEAKHWALVEFTFDLPGVKRTTKLVYADGDGRVPSLSKLELYADVEGKRSGLASEHRITELRFEAPEEKAFTLAAFGIAEDAPEEASK